MKRIALNLMLATSMFVMPAIIGCDKTVSEEKTVRTNSDGTTVKKEDKTVEHPDGSVERTTEKSVNH